MAHDVIVVGGGVIGCSAALELARRGLDVLVLERAELAAGASGRNQGLLLPNADPVYRDLFWENVEAYRRLAGEGVPFGLRPTGLLLLAGDDATLRSAKEQADGLTRAGFAVEALDPAGLTEAEPCLAPDLAGGFRHGDALALDPAATTLALAEAARRAGATVRGHAGVRRLLGDGERVTGVLVDDGPLAAGAVLLAAGPWSRALAASAGLDLPVGGARGWLLQTAPLPWTVGHVFEETSWPGPEGIGVQARPPTVGTLAEAGSAGPPAEGTAFTLQQGPGGHAVVGASLLASLREDPEQPETVHGLARRALRFVPRLAEAPVVASWSAVRPVSPDGYPLVGPWPGVAGLWVSGGHGAEGVQLAPASARMLAAQLVEGRAAPDAAPFDPARFA